MNVIGKSEELFVQLLNEILQNLGKYLLPIIILFVEIIFAIFLLEQKRVTKTKSVRKYKLDRRIKEYAEALADSPVYADMLIDSESREPVYISEKLVKTFQMNAAEIEDDIYRFWKKLNIVNEIEKLSAGLPKKKEARCEFCVSIKGEKRWFLCELSSVNEDEYILVHFTETTEEKNKTAQMEKEMEKIQEESESKTTFLSRMSHEIRTPMNGIIGLNQLALSTLDENAPATTYLRKLADSSNHLLDLINDILDMSRIEAGKVVLENTVIDIFSFGTKIDDMFRKTIEGKGLHFDVEYVDVDEQYLIGDELRLSQAIINFLSNAVKFTEKGEIIVTIKQMLKTKGVVSLMIRVHDTGIGMSNDFLNRINRPFEQESIETSKKYGGTGLGMAITDQIIQLMGGKIIVDSLPNVGSDFSVYVDLPIASAEEVKQQKEKNQEVQEEADTSFSFANKKILMAEDNELNAEIAMEILEAKGASVDLAQNGQEAIEQFENHAENYYDFILMDIQMPVLNGREAAKQIRMLPRKDAKSVFIFALSADAFVEDTRQSAQAGMNGHFTKPINFEEMEHEIGKLMRR